ncbi:MAG: hypothetical protein L3K23_02965 [Thermoplasmata archaeon]|nr:hypothetical protein [Thermoplasmata archaeon]
MTDPVADVTFLVNPPIADDELFDFYRENGICEEGYPREQATVVLRQSSVIVAGYRNGALVAIARAMFDGREAQLVEFCIARNVQGGPLRHANGSLIEHDASGVGHALGRVLLDELWRRGAQFVATYIAQGVEEPFYASLGFEENGGHRVYVIDRRPYVDRPRPPSPPT